MPGYTTRKAIDPAISMAKKLGLGIAALKGYQEASLPGLHYIKSLVK